MNDTTAKHTPGPWAIQMAEDCRGRQLDEMIKWVVTANENDLWVSTGPTWDAEHDAEAQANARLIAAAPELLEALQRLIDWHAERGTECVSECGNPACRSKSARAAIAKATGGAP